MDIKDLMIGDWVKVNGRNVKVVRIYTNGIDYTENDGSKTLVKIEKASPVIIEPAILHDNGWYEDNGKWISDDSFRNVKMVLGQDYEGPFTNVVVESPKCYADAFVTSVHELQHLLRFAGCKELVCHEHYDETLLDWLKRKRAELRKSLDEHDDPVVWGQENAIQQVIDYINKSGK